MLMVHRRHIIEPVEIRDRLQIGLVLDQLLGAAMQKSNMRINALDHFPVELQYEAQHTVSSGMLWPKVDGEVTGSCGSGRLRRGVGGERAGRLGHCFAFSSPGKG